MASVIVNESQFPEPVHEKTDPRPRGAYHLCEGFLTHLGDYSLGSAFLAEMSQQQKNTSKALLTGIEKLVNQILFIPNVPCQQICHEHVGKGMFPVKHFHHVRLIDSHHCAIGHCGCGAQAERLPCKATLSQEIALVQNAYGGFLPGLRHNGEFYLSFLYIKNSIGRVALSKDRLLFGKAATFLPPSMVERNVLGSNLLSFLAATMPVMIALLSRVPNAQEGREQRLRA